MTVVYTECGSPLLPPGPPRVLRALAADTARRALQREQRDGRGPSGASWAAVAAAHKWAYGLLDGDVDDRDAVDSIRCAAVSAARWAELTARSSGRRADWAKAAAGAAAAAALARVPLAATEESAHQALRQVDAAAGAEATQRPECRRQGRRLSVLLSEEAYIEAVARRV